jgi:hypothetical protein
MKMPKSNIADASEPLSAKERAQQRWREKQRQKGLESISVRVPADAVDFVKAVAARLRDGAAPADALASIMIEREPQKPVTPPTVHIKKGHPLDHRDWGPALPWPYPHDTS